GTTRSDERSGSPPGLVPWPLAPFAFPLARLLPGFDRNPGRGSGVMRSRGQQENMDAYLDFRASLRDALATGDPAVFRSFLRDAGQRFGDSELLAMGRWTGEALLPLMHRMIVADPHLGEHHKASRQWLREHGIAPRVKATGYGWSTELRQ